MAEKYAHLRREPQTSSQDCWFESDMGLHHIYCNQKVSAIFHKAATVVFLLIVVACTIAYVVFGG